MKNKLQIIQLLRGVAASVVVLHHFSAAFDSYGTGDSFIVSSKIGELCSFGVDIFFVISGFIMFYTQFYDESQTVSGFWVAIDFIKKRLKRIFPVYWVWTTLLLLMWVSSIALKSHEYTARYIIFSYLLIPSESEIGYFHPLLDQGWTLSFELYFYLVFGFILVFKKKIINFFWVTAIFSLLYLIGFMNLLGTEGKYLLTNSLILEFLFGGILAIIYMKYGCSSINKYWYLFFLIAGLILLFSSVYIEKDRVLELGLPSALILYSCLMIDKVFDISWEKYRFFLFLGESSYSIYLTHGFCVLAFGLLLKSVPFTFNYPDTLIVSVSVVTILSCSLTYLYVEKKIIKKMQHGFRK